MVSAPNGEPIVTTTLSQAHVSRLAEIHQVAFPNFFLSSLGYGFLRTFYRGFMDDASAVTVVAVRSDGTPVGAVVGTTQPAGFYSRLLKRRGLSFLASATASMAKRPSIVPRILRAVFYRGDSPSRDGMMALLASICIDPELQGGGLGRLMLAEWEVEARRSGSSAAYLTTDAENNTGVNKFYAGAGWELSETYSTKEGRKMNRFEKVLK